MGDRLRRCNGVSPCAQTRMPAAGARSTLGQASADADKPKPGQGDDMKRSKRVDGPSGRAAGAASMAAALLLAACGGGSDSGPTEQPAALATSCGARVNNT